MNPPLYSIILPTYNRAAMLRAAIRSVLAQTFESWECFVIDDGSTDSTPGVFEEFKRHPRLRLHRFEDNKRQHVRRNFAINMAHGEWVAFLDSDDLWLPRRLEAFAEAARLRPAADFWFCNAYRVEQDRVVALQFDPNLPLPEGQVPGWYAVGDRFLPYLTSTLSIRKSLFDRHGKFREDMQVQEDTELYARMLAAGHRVGVLREPLAVKRAHEWRSVHDFSVDFAETLVALQSGGAPPEVLSKAERALALELSAYFIRGLYPGNVHDFMRHHVTDRGPAYWRVLLLSLVPRFVLRAAKALRGLWIRLRYPPLETLGLQP